MLSSVTLYFQVTMIVMLKMFSFFFVVVFVFLLVRSCFLHRSLNASPRCIYHCNCLCLCLYVGHVMFSHASDQMSKVSKIALWRCSQNVFAIVTVFVFVIFAVFCWSGHVFSSLWSNVSKITSLKYLSVCSWIPWVSKIQHMSGPFTFCLESEEFEKFGKVGCAAAADLY